MLTMTENEKKKYFIKVSTDPMDSTSSGLLAIASEAANQGHEVVLFFAGDATKMLHKDVINNLHTVTFHGNGKAGEMGQKQRLLMLLTVVKFTLVKVLP